MNKHVLFGFLAVAVFAVHCSAVAQKPAPFRIAFIAYQNPQQLAEDLKPVANYLEKTLKRDVKYFVVTDYAGIVEALRNESADMGFMGPLQYVIAHEHAGAYPILGEVYQGKPTYVSKIFVRKDSGIKKLSDLKGKTIAFVDPISSSGYLYPLKAFKDAGLIERDAEEYFKRIYFAGGDEQALRSVLNEFVDAAGIGQYSYSLLRPDERDLVVSIGESSPIPSHCVVVRKNLPKELVKDVQSALLALNEGPNQKLLKHLYSVDGYVKVTDADYESVKAVAREFGFLK